MFNERDLFAKLIAKARLSNLSFDVYSFRKYEIVVDLIFAEKSQFKNLQEAFAAIFKKELFEREEWDISDEPAPSDKQWIEALKNIWIHEYFLKYRGICLEYVNSENFINRFKVDLFDVDSPESIVKELLMKLNNIETIQVKKGHVYDQIFGQSESHYFLFEWGIYD
ncbi:hypothetical protein [Bacillus pseudomycoides]|uniref:hypothetical protein n=1 Tax=Bacillus pseudomycoides TaxID=64104 RepID=UPI0020D21A1E|nr:hypothetical protein [Bacillus pseudomycoides]